jgi:site-specific DNA recombinase
MALGKPVDAISRRLFEALRLEIRYDHAHMASCEITLTGETIGTVARASRERPPAPARRGHAARPTTEPTAPLETSTGTSVLGSVRDMGRCRW